MVIEAMNDQECRGMLARTEIVRLACALDNQPYIVPIRIDVEGDFLYAYATVGQKIEWMRQNPKVCVEVDDFTSCVEWASLIVFGHYEELPNAPDYGDSRRIAERLFQRHAMWWEPAAVPVAAHDPRSPVAFRIRIVQINGRRARPDSVGQSGTPRASSEPKNKNAGVICRPPRW
jgi:nitroimidazol reductase NimA-like FMN-containing flavoprotein (pyridoxamine 5'-phosphate oxidase superfamily)